VRFYPEVNSDIDHLTEDKAYDFTGLCKANLNRLFIALRLSDDIPVVGERRTHFTGQQLLLFYLYYLQKGKTFLEMAKADIFGGDPRRYSLAIPTVVKYLHHNFYHKISGDSFRLWTTPAKVEAFRYAIWLHLQQRPTIEEQEFDPGIAGADFILDDLPFDHFQPFGFLDDYGISTARVGDEPRRRLGFAHDLQRAFYSGYFRHHGLKAQVVFLPNGMIGSVFIAALAHNDQGMQNMSGLNDYLETLLNGQQLPPSFVFLPALYADGIFSPLPSIIPKYIQTNRLTPLTRFQSRLNQRMASSRICIEHCFCSLHKTYFALFQNTTRLRLFCRGEHVRKLVLTSFLTLNCFFCLNHASSSMFGLVPPDLVDYLPINKVLVPAPNIQEAQLGELYYHGR
jgi:hypothetical protein